MGGRSVEDEILDSVEVLSSAVGETEKPVVRFQLKKKHVYTYIYLIERSKRNTLCFFNDRCNWWCQGAIYGFLVKNKTQQTCLSRSENSAASGEKAAELERVAEAYEIHRGSWSHVKAPSLGLGKRKESFEGEENT